MTGCPASGSSFPSELHFIHLQTTGHVISDVSGEGGMVSVSGTVRGTDDCRAGLLNCCWWEGLLETHWTAFQVPRGERVHCACAFRMGSSNSSSTTRSCTCFSGIISWPVDSITTPYNMTASLNNAVNKYAHVAGVMWIMNWKWCVGKWPWPILISWSFNVSVRNHGIHKQPDSPCFWGGGGWGGGSCLINACQKRYRSGKPLVMQLWGCT